MLTSGKFIIASLDKDTGVATPVLTPPAPPLPTEYATQAAAETEAARLAGVYTDKKYVVLEVPKIANADSVWE